MEKSFHRKCSHKAVYPQEPAYGEISNEDQLYEDVQESKISSSTRKRRSDKNPESLDNSGDRIIHIIRNIEKWVETYIQTCPNSERIVKRWGGSNGSGGFVGKWERQISKNPIFQEQAEAQKKRYFRNSANGDLRCGRIFREFGLHGHPLQLYDAGADPRNGIGRLSDTDFGDNQLMSMKPEKGIFQKQQIYSVWTLLQSNLKYSFNIKDAIFEHTNIPTQKDIHQFVMMNTGAQWSLTAMGPCLQTELRPSIAIVTRQVS